MNVEELIAELKQKGLADEEILQSLEQMVQEQQLTEEDLMKAKQLLSGGNPESQVSPEDEKKQAEELFGMKLI